MIHKVLHVACIGGGGHIPHGLASLIHLGLTAARAQTEQWPIVSVGRQAPKSMHWGAGTSWRLRAPPICVVWSP